MNRRIDMKVFVYDDLIMQLAGNLRTHNLRKMSRLTRSFSVRQLSPFSKPLLVNAIGIPAL
jgi:hypothetical protein